MSADVSGTAGSGPCRTIEGDAPVKGNIPHPVGLPAHERPDEERAEGESDEVNGGGIKLVDEHGEVVERGLEREGRRCCRRQEAPPLVLSTTRTCGSSPSTSPRTVARLPPGPP